MKNMIRLFTAAPALPSYPPGGFHHAALA